MWLCVCWQLSGSKICSSATLRSRCLSWTLFPPNICGLAQSAVHDWLYGLQAGCPGRSVAPLAESHSADRFLKITKWRCIHTHTLLKCGLVVDATEANCASGLWGCASLYEFNLPVCAHVVNMLSSVFASPGPTGLSVSKNICSLDPVVFKV